MVVNHARVLAVAAALALASCRAGGGEANRADTSGSKAQQSVDTASRADSASLGAHSAAELDSAARQIIGFLRGDVGFDSVRLADTVVLHVSPEGGGTRTAVARERLRDRGSWRVRGHGRATYSFVPPANASRIETRVGRHFNCQEYSLASRSAELARLPHVGVKLEPTDASSCLQVWNVTLVFDPHQKPPTLIAALYDQWEW